MLALCICGAAVYELPYLSWTFYDGIVEYFQVSDAQMGYLMSVYGIACVISDPAAMGLFFMGAVILPEKSQRVTSFFAVSPLKAWEYVGAKVLAGKRKDLLVIRYNDENVSNSFPQETVDKNDSPHYN